MTESSFIVTPICYGEYSLVGLPTVFSLPFLINQKSASSELVLKSTKSPNVIFLL